MRKFFSAAVSAALCAVLLAALPALAQSNVRPIFDNRANGGSATQDVTPAFPLPTSLSTSSKTVGTTTWTKTTFTQTGASATMLAASTTRTGFMVYNPTTNATVWVDVAGGTATSEASIPVPPGSYLAVTGLVTPVTLITTLGTNTQTMTVWEGH